MTPRRSLSSMRPSAMDAPGLSGRGTKARQQSKSRMRALLRQ
nr:MAG TPA: hypothetical protein [Caudoviricetes sp.]